MTVVLLLHPKINCMTIPPMVPVKYFRTIPLYGSFSNHISRSFLNHSFHWFDLNDVMQVLGLFHSARRIKLNDVIINCFNPLNAKTLIVFNVTLPYIPEQR